MRRVTFPAALSGPAGSGNLAGRGTGQKGAAIGEEGRGADQKKPTSSVKEVTSLLKKNEKAKALPEALSRQDRIRSRFPGKKVAFPDEIPIPPRKPEYQVGADDVLSILVWNQPDLSVPQVIVRKDGKISLPLVGNIHIEGMTIPQLEARIRQELNRFIENPQITVNPKEMNSQRIFLIGQIKKPLTGGLLPNFMLRGGNTLLEALADGEFYPDADLTASYIARGDLIIPVDIKALLMDGDLGQNVLLKAGDRIVVPGPMKEVNILGEVAGPGKYKVRRDASLLDVLSLALGPKKDTADLYRAYLARNKQIFPLRLKELLDSGDMSLNLQMEDGDILYIPNSEEKKFYLLGEVGKPGVFHFKDPVDAIEAIAQGGGFLTSARRSQVVVVRGDMQKPQIFELDLLAMLEGKSFERFILEKGDILYVPRTYIADWNVFINQIFPTFQAVVLVDVLRRW